MSPKTPFSYRICVTLKLAWWTFATAAITLAATGEVADEAKPRAMDAFRKLPLGFEWNSGQADSSVKAFARGPGFAVLLRANDSMAILTRGGKRSVVRWTPLRARSAPELVPAEPLPATANYFLGNDPSRWTRGVKSFGRMRYSEVYPGIDLVYYGKQDSLEYDFVVAPGADPSKVAMAVTGADRLRLDAGDLVIETSAGSLRHHKPYSYQDIDGERREVASRFVLQGNRLKFEIGAYDTTKPLVIDPSLSFSTFLGGSGEDRAISTAIDSIGNTFIAGSTSSLDFRPLTPNAPYPSNSGGATDGFLTMLLTGGGSNAYISSYIGGSGADEINAVVVADFPPNVYLVGTTTSTNFPSVLAVQGRNAGGSDAFVMKVGFPATIFFSTYFGGSGDDHGRAVALDSGGHIQFAGYTNSTNLPTQSPLQPSNAGRYDAFLAKLTNFGAPLVFSTYYGGAFDDLAYGLAVDPLANSYLTGTTMSTNLGAPGTTGYIVPNQLFVTSINSNAGVRRYQRILGGNGITLGKGIAVDSSLNAYVTGYTSSPTYPVTPNALQGTHAGGNYDAFVTKFNGTGSILYSTFLGGSGQDLASGIGLDSSGNLTIAGATSSTNFPVVAPLQSQNAGGFDGFVSRIRPNLSGLAFSTYLGGSGADSILGIAVGAQGNMVVVGSTGSANFPTTPGVIGPTKAAGSDAFATRILQN